jgi:hypothetical protein
MFGSGGEYAGVDIAGWAEIVGNGWIGIGNTCVGTGARIEDDGVDIAIGISIAAADLVVVRGVTGDSECGFAL